MNERIGLKELVKSIVAENFPQETFAFDISADDLINKLYLDGNIETSVSKETQVNFLEQATSVLGFIGVLISTYKAVVEIRSLKLKQKLDQQTIEKNWLASLVDSGLTKEEAGKIVNNHIHQMKDLV